MPFSILSYLCHPVLRRCLAAVLLSVSAGAVMACLATPGATCSSDASSPASQALGTSVNLGAGNPTNVINGSNTCRVLKDDRHGWSVLVRSPGSYCFEKDLKQKDPIKFLSLPHQSGPNSPMLAIEARSVTVDLQQHVLDGDRPAALGLWVNGEGGQYQSISVRNGTIRTQRRAAVYMVNAWNRENARFENRAVAGGLAVAKSKDDYIETKFVLEDLTIEADGVAVILQGKGNVIRRCKIVGGNGAINLYGPATVFEDNEVVFSAGESKDNPELPIAIYLEDADGSIVRNNRITMRGRAAGAEAIVLKNSANVTLQGNTVNGGKQTDAFPDQGSSVKAR